MKFLSMFARLSIFCLFTFFLQSAKASDLLSSSCLVVSSGVQSTDANFSLRTKPSVFTCEELKSAQTALEAISAAIIPVSRVLANPQVKEALMSELSSLGMTLSNPAILAATVIGAVGITTVYIVIHKSVQECAELDQQEFKQSLHDELAQKYNINTGPQFSFQTNLH